MTATMFCTVYSSMIVKREGEGVTYELKFVFVFIDVFLRHRDLIVFLKIQKGVTIRNFSLFFFFFIVISYKRLGRDIHIKKIESLPIRIRFCKHLLREGIFLRRRQAINCMLDLAQRQKREEGPHLFNNIIIV
jgi:hypothetical protein